jgi:hypothetical protein
MTESTTKRPTSAFVVDAGAARCLQELRRSLPPRRVTRRIDGLRIAHYDKRLQTGQ